MTAAIARLLAPLAPRERLLVALMTAIGAVAAAMLLVVAPLRDSIGAAEARLAESRALLGWVETQAAEAERLRAARSAPGDAPPAGPTGLADIEASLDDYGLRSNLARLAPASDGMIEARLEGVSFVALQGWLAGTGLGERLDRLTVEQAGSPDRVNAGFTAAVGGDRP